MKKSFLIALFPIFIACQQSNKNQKFSEKESNNFINIISNNAKVTIDDITEFQKLPTNNFVITTKYPLPKEKLVAYNKNGGTLSNDDNDISDFATYTIVNYNLVNEKNEKIELINNSNSLQETSLWENNKVLNQNLMIKLKTNKKFEKLIGELNVKFEITPGSKKEVKIPVKISVNDILSE